MTGIDFDNLQSLIEVNASIDELNAQLSDRKKEREHIESLLLEEFGLSGVRSMNVNGKCIYVRTDHHVSAKAECKGQLVEWAKAHGLDNIVVVQPQSLKAWATEQIQEQGALPDDLTPLVNIFDKPRVCVRKAD